MQSLISCTQIKSAYKDNSNILLNKFIELTENKTTSEDVLRCLLRYPNAQNYGRWQESADEGLIFFMDNMPAYIRELMMYRNKVFTVCGNCGYRGDITLQHHTQFMMYGTNIHNTEEFIKTLKLRAEYDADYKCDKCHLKNPKTIRYEKLDMLPEIIVLLYNKFNYAEKSKLHYFPPEFTISNMKYQQVAQIRHYGSLNGGHYVANVLRDNIYMTNDEHISTGTLEPDQSVFLVFYSYKGRPLRTPTNYEPFKIRGHPHNDLSDYKPFKIRGTQ